MSEILKTSTSLGGGELSAALKELLHQYEDRCAEMEALAESPVDDHAERGAAIASVFAALEPLPDEFSELMTKRFALASAAVERAAAGDAERRSEGNKLRSELAAIKAAGELATLNEIQSLKAKWNGFWRESAESAAEWTAEIGNLETALAAEAAEKTRRGESADALTAELNDLTGREDVEALKTRRGEIEAAYAALGDVPKSSAGKYQEAHRKAQTLLARHYETLDFARWESYTLKLDLLAELDKMREVPETELSAISKRLVEIREKWKALGSVPKEKSDEVNPRYLELTRTLQHRVDEYFSNLRQERKNAAAEKEKLCVEAESNAGRTDWGPGSALFRELQAKWKALPRSGSREQELFSRFHAAADKFFSARNAVFAERDQQHAAAAERKKKLIDEIATLTDVRRAKSMRAEYLAIGGAGREEQELFRAFNTALEGFFSARNAAFAEKEKETSGLIDELSALADGDPVAATPRAREIRNRVEELGCRKMTAAMDKACAKFDAALRSAEKKAFVNRWDAYRAAAAAAAELLNDPSGAIPESVAAFPKLVTSLEAAAAAAGGEEKAVSAWEKQLAHTRAECARIVSEAEKLSGGGSEKADRPVDLAAELQAAIMGNFARREAEAHRPRTDAKTLRKEFMALGVLPVGELTAALEKLSSL